MDRAGDGAGLQLGMKLLLAAVLAACSTQARAEESLSRTAKIAAEALAKALPLGGDAALEANLKEADRYRKTALRNASIKLSRLKGQIAKGAPTSAYDADTLKFVKSWLNAAPGDADFSDTLTTAISAIVQNRALDPEYSIFPESRKVCEDIDKTKKIRANAYNVAGKIYLCEPWTKGSVECRRVVVIHEVFHTLGLTDLSAGLKFPARTTKQALTDAAYMAGLASQLHSKHEDSCP